MTVAAFLDVSGVALFPVTLTESARFGLALPEVDGWACLDGARFPGATAVLVAEALVSNRFAPNVLIVAGRLSGSLDTDELLSHAFEDSASLPEWAELEHDRARFCGHPSALVSGRYRAGDELLFATTRYIVVEHIVDRYLIQVTTTILDAHRPALSATVGVLMNGTRVRCSEGDGGSL